MPSSVIRDYEYDEDTGLLRVTFVSGLTYEYFGVPQDEYENFVTASSQGHFFNTRVRDRYDSRRVE